MINRGHSGKTEFGLRSGQDGSPLQQFQSHSMSEVGDSDVKTLVGDWADSKMKEGRKAW